MKKKFKENLKEIIQCLLVLFSPVIIFIILAILGIEI